MKIVGFGQLFVVETGQMVGQLVIEHGQAQVSITISEEDLQQITQLMNGEPEPEMSAFQALHQPLDPPPPAYQATPPQYVGQFPGPAPMLPVLPRAPLQYEDGPLIGELAQEPAPPIIDSEGFARAPMARTIQQDEMGYPIVHGRRAPQEVLPNDDGRQF